MYDRSHENVSSLGFRNSIFTEGPAGPVGSLVEQHLALNVLLATFLKAESSQSFSVCHSLYVSRTFLLKS